MIVFDINLCISSHACYILHFRDVMPEDSAQSAAEWALNRLIKNMGEAKTLAIRLSSVKHQDQLRA